MASYFPQTEIARTLRMQPPLLMLDQAWLTPDGDEDGTPPHAGAVRLLSINEAVFAGHFPGHPILPGVLQIAAMAQLSEMLCQHMNGGRRCFLSALKRIKFRRPVFPGAAMQVKSELQGRSGGDNGTEESCEFKVSCSVDGTTVSCGSLTLVPWPEKNFASGAAATPAEHSIGSLADGAALMRILPHRPPFLLLDGVYGLGGDLSHLHGFKNVTGGDSLLASSGCDCYPPYLMLESAAQLGCACMLSQPGNDGLLGIFMGIDEAHFTRPALPGERLELTGGCQSLGKAGMGDIAFSCGGAAIGSCQLKFVLSSGSDVG